AGRGQPSEASSRERARPRAELELGPALGSDELDTERPCVHLPRQLRAVHAPIAPLEPRIVGAAQMTLAGAAQPGELGRRERSARPPNGVVAADTARPPAIEGSPPHRRYRFEHLELAAALEDDADVGPARAGDLADDRALSRAGLLEGQVPR